MTDAVGGKLIHTIVKEFTSGISSGFLVSQSCRSCVRREPISPIRSCSRGGRRASSGLSSAVSAGQSAVSSRAVTDTIPRPHGHLRAPTACGVSAPRTRWSAPTGW